MKQRVGGDWPHKVAASGVGRGPTGEEQVRRQQEWSRSVREAQRRVRREAQEAEPLKREKEVLGRLTATVIVLAEDPGTPSSILVGADKLLREAAPRILGSGSHENEEALKQVVHELTEGDVEEVKRRYRPYSLVKEDREMFKNCEGGINKQAMEEVTAFLREKLEKVG